MRKMCDVTRRWLSRRTLRSLGTEEDTVINGGPSVFKLSEDSNGLSVKCKLSA